MPAPDLRPALAGLPGVAATDPSAMVDLLDDLRAELSAQRRTSRPFAAECERLAWALGQADEAYCRRIDADGAWDWGARALVQEPLPLSLPLEVPHAA